MASGCRVKGRRVGDEGLKLAAVDIDACGMMTWRSGVLAFNQLKFQCFCDGCKVDACRCPGKYIKFRHDHGLNLFFS